MAGYCVVNCRCSHLGPWDGKLVVPAAELPVSGSLRMGREMGPVRWRGPELIVRHGCVRKTEGSGGEDHVETGIISQRMDARLADWSPMAAKGRLWKPIQGTERGRG